MQKRQIVLIWAGAAAVLGGLIVWGVLAPPVPLYFTPIPLLVALGLTVPSRTFKYYLVMAAMFGAELLLSYLFYLFTVSSHILYAIFSLLLFAGIAFYLIYTRYREKIKIKEKSEVLAGYAKTARTVVIVFFAAFGVLIVVKSIVVLISAIR